MKKWWTSKTIWVNGLAFLALILQSALGWVIPAEYQVMALPIINLALRKITSSEIVW